MNLNAIYLIVAPSGAGKTTLVNALSERYGLSSIPSYTTRPPRYEGEIGHVFVTKQEFDELPNKVAYTMFDGHEYCTTAEQIDNYNLYVIDPAGIEYLKAHYIGNKKLVTVYVSSTESEREDRMADRGDSIYKIRERILHDKEAFANKLYDYIIYNREGYFDDAVKALYSLIAKIENL